MNRELTLQQIAEGIPKSVLNASDKDVEGFQQIIEQTLKVREEHKDLQRMIQNYSGSKNHPGAKRSS